MFSTPDLEKPKENRCFLPQAGPWPKLPRTSRARNIFGHVWSTFGQHLTKFDQAGMSKIWGLLFFWGKKTPEATWAGKPGFMYHPSLAWLACLALACLAILASYRPRSPCLHQQQRPRRWKSRRRRERRPKADVNRDFGLGAFRRPAQNHA